MSSTAKSSVCHRVVLVASTLLLVYGVSRVILADVPGAKRPAPRQDNGPSRSEPVRPALTKETTALRVHNVRLEPGPLAESSPSATLKFDMLNDGASRLTNIVLEVSILEKHQQEQSNGRQNVLVRPFTIREKVVLQPGYSMEYELRLRNFSSDCSCVPRVDIVSVESLGDSKSFR